MPSQLIISVSPWDVRAALMEDGRLAEFYVERAGRQDPTGNIYKGRVVKVLPGMAAAFVDVGLDRPGYLFAQEAAPYLNDLPDSWCPEDPEDGRPQPPTPPIQDLVAEGQELLVQVWRPPQGSKGARLTTHITLPGRFLVYLPTQPHLAVSRRLSPETERQRLKALLEDLGLQAGGLIARTASAGQRLATLAGEKEALVARWRQIRQKNRQAACPARLYEELPMLRRLVRDLVSPEVTRILVDDPTAAKEIEAYLKVEQANQAVVIDDYQGQEPLLAKFGLEDNWRRLMLPQVWLKSGGYLVINPTEALTAIDVNSGRFVRGRDFEDTILTTNLEAAREIARQVRLRNLSGIIVIDFIDMENAAHRDLLYQTLKEALQRDRARTTVYPMSPLGLVEMTRQRLGDSLAQVVTEPCPCCGGAGEVLSPLTLACDLMRLLTAEAREFPGALLVLSVHPLVAAVLREAGRPLLARLETEHRVRVELREDPRFSRQHHELTRELHKDGKPQG
jgi:ribonuclease G